MRYLAAALVLAACASDPAPVTDAGPPGDLGASDVGAVDAGSMDAGPADAGGADVSDDATTLDASDAGGVDTGTDVVRVDGAPCIPACAAGSVCVGGVCESVDGAAGDGGRMYPTGPYGSREGALFEPFALPGCNLPEGSDGWRFDQDDFWTSRATVLMLVAAWCQTCQQEAAATEQELVQAYRGRGVRVVHVLVQDDQRRTPTVEVCSVWVARHGLTVPVLIDAQFITQAFVPMAAFPGAVVVGADGRILARAHGNPTLAAIRTALDAALPTP